MLGEMLGGILDWTESVMDLGWWGVPIFLGIGALIGAALSYLTQRSSGDTRAWAFLGAYFGLMALALIWLWIVLLVVAVIAASGLGGRSGGLGLGRRPSVRSTLRRTARSRPAKRRRTGGTLDAGLSPGAGKRRTVGGGGRGGGGGGGGGGDGGGEA